MEEKQTMERRLRKTEVEPLMDVQVLIVDDHPDIINTLHKIFSTFTGANVTTARNGTEAISLVKRQSEKGKRPDIVITDLSMVGGSGEYLIKALAPTEKTEETAGIPIIVISAIPEVAISKPTSLPTLQRLNPNVVSIITKDDFRGENLINICQRALGETPTFEE